MTTAPKRFRDLGFEVYAWLIYSIPFIVTTLAAPVSSFYKYAAVMLFAAFLPLYFAGYFIRGPRILWIIAGLDAIAVAGSSFNPSSASFFI